MSQLAHEPSAPAQPLEAVACRLQEIAAAARADALSQTALTLADIAPGESADAWTGGLWASRALRLVGMREVLGHRLAGALEYQLGRHIASQCVAPSLEALLAVMAQIGLGHPSVVERTQRSVTLDDFECTASRGLPNIGETVCHLEAGFVSRGLELCTGGTVAARETMCFAAGHDRCRIVADLRSPGPGELLVGGEGHMGQGAVEIVAGLAGVAGEAVRLADELQRKNEMLEHLATTDPLTGLQNRRAVLSRLADEVQRSVRYQTPLTLAILDIDDFKHVNDAYGHDTGDRVLVRTARTIATSLRETDQAGRHGGEEFVILCPYLGAEQAWSALDRVRQAVASDRRTPRLTVSIGVVTSPPVMPDASAMLRLADKALYSAKRAGKNRVEIAAPV
jgi:diguanylate cyclase (GGDEF)-like protein